MNIKYLKETIIPTRRIEIEKGLNMGTRQPIYVVLDLTYSFITGHDDLGWFSGELFNYKAKPEEYGYVDISLDYEDRSFQLNSEGMSSPEPVTKMYNDDIKAFFLTRNGAEQYLENQKHNLTKEAYIYTFYSGYGNREMDNLLENG